MAAITITETIADRRKATTEDLLAIPDDGIERWLVNGEIREVGMAMRNKDHAWIETRIAQYLANWNDSLNPPRGRVYSGEVGVRLSRDPEVSVGIDVAYLTAEMVAGQTASESWIIEGPPLLAIEIVSQSDTVKLINEKIRLYQTHHVPLIWVVDPYLKTIAIPRTGQPPIMLTEDHELSGEPQLPGFRIAVKRIFE